LSFWFGSSLLAVYSSGYRNEKDTRGSVEYAGAATDLFVSPVAVSHIVMLERSTNVWKVYSRIQY